MKELWDERGYEYLGLSCQNLRDHAARLEKTMGDTIAINSGKGIKENVETTEGSLNYGSSSGSQHKSSSGSQHDIQFDDIIDNAIEDQYEDTMRSLRSTSANSQEGITINTSLPEHEITEKPAIIKWGKDKNGVLINIQSSDIIKAYEEIILWRKNVFLVPYGKIGIIDQLTTHVNQWNSKSEQQHIALKAVFVLLAVGLQKPGPKSKAKDHKECLTKRLALWKDGQIDKLLREGRMIQARIGKSKKSEPPDRAKIFAKLVMEGQINSAMRSLSEEGNGGVLPLSDDVMLQLRQKHPEAEEAKIGTLLRGPVQEVIESLFIPINGQMVREAALRTKGSGGPSGVDANGFKRTLACKSFKKSSTALCEALATLTKTLCTEFVDPTLIDALVASRLRESYNIYLPNLICVCF